MYQYHIWIPFYKYHYLVDYQNVWLSTDNLIQNLNAVSSQAVFAQKIPKHILVTKRFLYERKGEGGEKIFAQPIEYVAIHFDYVKDILPRYRFMMQQKYLESIHWVEVGYVIPQSFIMIVNMIVKWC